MFLGLSARQTVEQSPKDYMELLHAALEGVVTS